MSGKRLGHIDIHNTVKFYFLANWDITAAVGRIVSDTSQSLSVRSPDLCRCVHRVAGGK